MPASKRGDPITAHNIPMPTSRTNLILGIATCLLSTSLLFAESVIEYSAPKKVGKLDKSIDESSGIAASRRRADVLWTHNDSGDSPRLFAIDLKGKSLGECRLEKIKQVDWEDMASFQLDGQAYLAIGDFGDNAQQRKNVQLHLVREPEPSDKKAKVDRTIPFTYENGPIDCECLAIDPTRNLVVLVAKGWTPMCEVFTFKLPDKDDDTQPVARRVATLKLAGATGLDISPDGKRAVVVTYGNAYEYVRGENETWGVAFAREGREIKMPKRKQGEAICYGSDGETLFVTSEHAPSPLFRIKPKRASTDSKDDKQAPDNYTEEQDR